MPSGIFNLKQQIQEITLGAWSGQKTPAVDYLVVAGGGGGGHEGCTSVGAGGGGAGGLLQGILNVTSGTPITVTIGSGGAGSTSAAVIGGTGANSVFSSITTIGGGGGASTGLSGPNASSGGSGGGGGNEAADGSCRPNGTPGKGILGQGNTGGAGYGCGNASLTGPGGGGGGAGTIGLNGNCSTAGSGGVGVASAISGTITTYSGGGGGGTNGGAPAGSGGTGGGGAGGTGATNGTNGTVNTGGGGGASGRGGGGAGQGGSGIVIISYPDIYNAPSAFGGANSPTASTSGSGSFSLNGSNQYVTYPQNSAFAFGSSAFTVEFWIYPTSNLPAFASPFTTGSTSGDFVIDVQSTGLYLDVNNNATVTATSSIALTLNAWNHVAVSRGASGSTLYIFINGQIGASVTNSTSWTNTGVVTIGKQSNIYVPGYISNLRVVKGTQVYSSAFTPPTAPLTAIANTSLLLNTVSPSAFNDSSTNAFTPTVYNNSSWNQSSPFATGLGYKNRVYTWTGSGTVTF
jgi:hypothetical protein